MFKKQVKKLVDQYMGPYTIEKIMSTNIIKLKLPTIMKIHLVVNISWVVRYRELVKGQKVEKLVEVDGEEKWEVEKILNRWKIREVTKYLVY